MSRQRSPERGSGTDPAMNEYEEAFIDHKDAQTAIDLRQTDVLIVSKGARYKQPLRRGAVGKRAILRVDLGKLFDPSEDKEMVTHVGSHPRILGALLSLNEMKERMSNIKGFMRSVGPRRRLHWGDGMQWRKNQSLWSWASVSPWYTL